MALNKRMGILLMTIGLTVSLAGCQDNMKEAQETVKDTVGQVANGAVASLQNVIVKEDSADAVSEQGDFTFDLSKASKLSIRHNVGKITIKADDSVKEGTVHYTKVLSKKSASQDEQKAMLKDYVIDVNMLGDTYEVNTEAQDKFGAQDKDNFHCDFEITVPSSYLIDITHKVGDVQVNGMGSTVNAKVDVGKIDIDGFKGTVNAEATTGAISIKGGQEIKKLYAVSNTGAITVSVPESANLKVKAETSAIGEIATDVPMVVDTKEKGLLEGTIGDGSAGELKLSTKTGKIQINKQ